jgi:hypothetical protein
MNELANQYDEQVVAMTKELQSKEAEILIKLGEMKRLNLFAPLGYTGIFDYCERRLKLSYYQAGYYNRVHEKSETVPEIKQAVVEGKITLSQARRIEPAVTKENCSEWIEKANTFRQRELEKAVAEVNPRAHVREKIRPIAKDVNELKSPVDNKTEANIAALKDILSQKLKRAATLSEVLAWMAD